MVPRRSPRPDCWTAPPGGGCKIASRRADRVQVETLTFPQTVRADPAGLAWFAMRCTLIYLIIIGRLC